jgi:hypothetical protein
MSIRSARPHCQKTGSYLIKFPRVPRFELKYGSVVPWNGATFYCTSFKGVYFLSLFLPSAARLPLGHIFILFFWRQTIEERINNLSEWRARKLLMLRRMKSCQRTHLIHLAMPLTIATKTKAVAATPLSWSTTSLTHGAWAIFDYIYSAL